MIILAIAEIAASLAGIVAFGLEMDTDGVGLIPDIAVLAREVVRLREALQEIADVSRANAGFFSGRGDGVEGIARDALEGPT